MLEYFYLTVRFGDVNIADVANHKHLGLTLSSKFPWTDHITSIIINISVMSDEL
jgi:hypothetical protein